MARPDVHDPGCLTDVDGVLVGHFDRSGRGWLTGTTVVSAPLGGVAAVEVRGGGPGTRETDALAPGNLVDRVHAICLTGGSAYGLAAADGVMAELERRQLGVPVGPDPSHVVPVVPTAVIFDLGRGGTFTHRPDASFGSRAFRAARVAPRRGSVGAGTGSRAGGLRGGVGSASATVRIGDDDVTIGALAVLNASGSPIDPSTGTPWIGHPAVRRPSSVERRALVAAIADREEHRALNTTIGVVATDADLTRPEARRLAQSAHDGLARAVRPAHGLTDGDTIFALSIGRFELPIEPLGLVRTPHSRAVHLNALCAAAADVFAVACADAVVRAGTTVGTSGDTIAYADLCPSALRP